MHFTAYAEKRFLSSELLNSMYWDEQKRTQTSIKHAAILNAQENK